MFIAEVSKKYNISADTLRYYERIKLIPTVRRKKNGIRDYSEEDLNWVAFIKCMRNAGLPIEVLIEYLALFKQGDDTIEVRKELLQEQHDKLIIRINEMKETLERLDHKIEGYGGTLLEREHELIKEKEKHKKN